MDKEDYDGALAFIEETLKDLERAIERWDVDRVSKMIAEMERGAKELQGWRHDVYERALGDGRVETARAIVEARKPIALAGASDY